MTILAFPTPSTASAPDSDEIFEAHLGGKLSVETVRPLSTQRDLSIAYTPGVAQVSRAIADDPQLAASHTWAGRLVAVISDGTAVLGLGDIGPAASLPVMEGKAALFRTFAGLNSIPIVLDTTDPDEIVETIIRLRPSFGAINLEDISAPRCFEIERRLIDALDIPVMHDDQHGTAVVVYAALLGAARLLDRPATGMRVVISGAGAAGIAIAEMLLAVGVDHVTLVDSQGIIYRGRPGLSGIKADIAQRTNPDAVEGLLADALRGANVFVGVSSVVVPEEVLAEMAPDAVVFALSNPTPEVAPELAARYARIVATGRSDYPNQINNVLAFPGIFRGALDAGATKITQRMKIAAAEAIAGLVGDELREDYIVPSPLDPRVADAVAAGVIAAVEDAAVEDAAVEDAGTADAEHAG